MSDEGAASQYQVLEELGSESLSFFSSKFLTLNRADRQSGGSFGVVYKAFERATGDVVAIKHVGRASSFVYSHPLTQYNPDRSRIQRGRHPRNPARNISAQYLRQSLCDTIQSEFSARTQTMDCYGVPWWRVMP